MTEESFLEAYDKYADAIFRHCFFRVRDRELALDLTQETFCKVWSYASMGKEIREIRPFLYKTAQNLIIDDSRKKKSVSLDEMMEAGYEPHEARAASPEHLHEGKEVLLRVYTLPEIYQEPLLMRYVDGLSPKEIAQTLELSLNVVSVRIHRGIQELKKQLNVQYNG